MIYECRVAGVLRKTIDDNSNKQQLYKLNFDKIEKMARKREMEENEAILSDQPNSGTSSCRGATVHLLPHRRHPVLSTTWCDCDAVAQKYQPLISAGAVTIGEWPTGVSWRRPTTPDDPQRATNANQLSAMCKIGMTRTQQYGSSGSFLLLLLVWSQTKHQWQTDRTVNKTMKGKLFGFRAKCSAGSACARASPGRPL
jgi:hypothetical protein